MEKKEIQKAYSEAERELKDKQIDQVKELVKRTLIKMDDLDKQINKLQDERKILKLDVQDLKDGRLDRISERQEKDKKAADISVAKIVKEVHHYHHYDYWYTPWHIIWNQPYTPVYYGGTVYGASSTLGWSMGGTSLTLSSNNDCVNVDCGKEFIINCSLAKDFSAGTYDINGKIVNIS